jgi:GNAT superfamily N-acetyltransferase
MLITETRTTVVRIAERPDLISMVAWWLWSAFLQKDGNTLQDAIRLVEVSTEKGTNQTFVLLIDDRPIGTATLAVADGSGWRTLKPWLTGVYIISSERGHGHLRLLMDAVDAACRAAGHPLICLYTDTAQRIYEHLGWESIKAFDHNGRFTTLMQKGF